MKELRKRDKISGECSKCGCATLDVKYDNAFGRLNMECLRCGFKWEEEPLDATFNI